MKLRTIGGIELNSIAIGMHAVDEMVKSAKVELVLARPTCPGRYLAMITGDTSAVSEAVKKGRDVGGEMVIDDFIIPNVHDDLIPALNGTSPADAINALGVIETYSTTSCILAADAAAKAGSVSLLEIRFAAGLAGKAFVVMTGDVGSVQSAVAAGVAGVGDAGPVLSHVVIPSPCAELKALLR